MASNEPLVLRILITGASSGIGLSTASFLLDAGHTVTMAARTREPMDELAGNHEGRAFVFVADMKDAEACQQLVADAAEAMGGLDTLINNAGAGGSVGLSIESTSLDEWANVMKVNLKAPFVLTQAAIPFLEASATPSVVNVSSICSKRPFKGLLPYCVSKAGLDQLTQCCAMDLAAKGIRVNAVNPASVPTNFHTSMGIPAAMVDSYMELGKQLHPLGRVGTGVDVAEAISFLIDSRKSGWMTGVTLPVDGGRLMTCSSGATLSGEGVPGDDDDDDAAADAAENEAAD